MGSEQTLGPGPPGAADYIFENAAEHPHARLKALSAVFARGTIRHLSARGIKKGWHCLRL